MNKEVLVSKITDYLINAHKDYILFISPIGNTTNNAGCDDVNLLLITSNLSYDRNENIMKYIRENFDNSKINIIFTSKKETMNSNCLNNKAMQALYLCQKGIIKSLYHNPNFSYQIDENIIKGASPIVCLEEISYIVSTVADFDNLPNKINKQSELLNAVYSALTKYFITMDLFPHNISECLESLRNQSQIHLDLDIEKILHNDISNKNDFEKLKKFSFAVAEFLLERLNERNYTQSTTQDIRVKINDVTYKVRAGGLIEYKNKFLLVKMGLGSYWCVPGGHLEWFENSENAVIREVEEETCMPVEVKNLFLLHENFYFNVKKQKFHEMCFYYLLKPKDEQNVIVDQTREEFDKGKKDVLEFKWFTREEIKNLDIKPTIIKEMIVENKINQMNHEIKKNVND